MLKKNQKGFAHLELILIILVLAVIGFVGYKIYHSLKQHKQLQSSAKTANDSADNNTINDLYTLTNGILKYGNKNNTLPKSLTDLKVSLSNSISSYQYSADTVPADTQLQVQGPGNYTSFTLCGYFKNNGLPPPSFNNDSDIKSALKYYYKGNQCYTYTFPEYGVGGGDVLTPNYSATQKNSYDNSFLQPTAIGRSMCLESNTKNGNQYGQVALSGGATCTDAMAVINATGPYGDYYSSMGYYCKTYDNSYSPKTWQAYYKGNFHIYDCTKGNSQIAFTLQTTQEKQY